MTINLRPLTEEQRQLGEFYQVDNVDDLVRAQEKHILQLQDMVPRIPDQFRRAPREG